MIRFREQRVWLNQLYDLGLETKEDAQEFLTAHMASLQEELTGFVSEEHLRVFAIRNIRHSLHYDFKFNGRGTEEQLNHLLSLFPEA